MAKKPASHSASSKTTTPVAAAKPPPAARTASGAISTPSTTPAKPLTSSSLSARSSPQEIIVHVWNRYLQDTPSRTMLLDVFMAWLVVVGGIQFIYCVLAGNYVCIVFLLEGNYLTLLLALQCLSLRFLRRSRPVRSHSFPTNADVRTTSNRRIHSNKEDHIKNSRRSQWGTGGRRESQHRKSVCGLCIWQLDPARLLCELHQLEYSRSRSFGGVESEWRWQWHG